MTRRFQYSLRNLLGLVTLVAVLCSLLVTFTPYAVAVVVAATPPGAGSGMYVAQRRLGLVAGMVFAVRWTAIPLLIAVIMHDAWPFLALLAVAMASAIGGVKGGYACEAVEV